MAKRKSPHADAGAFLEAGHFEGLATTRRPRLQANPAMQRRLRWLAKLAPFSMMEVRHG